MNLIIRDGRVDKYATEEDFFGLQATIAEDIRRITIYLSELKNGSEKLLSLLDKIKKLIRSGINSEISIVDNYIVFNLDDQENSFFRSEDEYPEIVILKRNMRDFYFIRKLEIMDVYNESDDLKKSDLCLANYQVCYYGVNNDTVNYKEAQIKKYYQDTFEEPFDKTEEFVFELDRVLSKVIPFPGSKEEK